MSRQSFQSSTSSNPPHVGESRPIAIGGSPQALRPRPIDSAISPTDENHRATSEQKQSNTHGNQLRGRKYPGQDDAPELPVTPDLSVQNFGNHASPSSVDGQQLTGHDSSPIFPVEVHALKGSTRAPPKVPTVEKSLLSAQMQESKGSKQNSKADGRGHHNSAEQISESGIRTDMFRGGHSKFLSAVNLTRSYSW